MTTSLAPIRPLQVSKFWLSVITGCLITLQVHSTWKAGLANLVVTSILFFAAILWQLNKKKHRLNLESDLLSIILGILAIAFVVFNLIFLQNYPFAIRLIPLLSALAIGLLASGIKGLKQYWQELLRLTILSIPLESSIDPINEFFGVTTLLAKFSTFILWYLGFDVSRQGEFIILTAKATWVGPNCSGILTMLWMLQLGVLFLVLFPTKLIHKVSVPVVAVSIVIVVNAIRIAIMSVLAAHNYQMFEYWHSDKAQIFSTIPLVVFVAFCKSLIQSKEESKKDLSE